jgi:hypothetical protein
MYVLVPLCPIRHTTLNTIQLNSTLCPKPANVHRALSQKRKQEEKIK